MGVKVCGNTGYNRKKNGYSKGGLIGKAINSTEGANGGFVLAHSGEYILNEAQLKLASSMVDNLINFAKFMPKSATTSTSQNVENTFNLAVTLPNVTDEQQFVKWLQTSKAAQDIVRSMTVNVASKSPLNKNTLNKLKYK